MVDGTIADIGAALSAQEGEETHEFSGCGISPGWFDLRAGLCVPGFEHKDTLETLARSAAAGGFTDIAVLPNTHPPIQSKEGVTFVRESSRWLPVNFHVIAAASENLAGENMTELQDLHHAGAIAFSDGTKPLHDEALIKRILLYLKGFGGLLINVPDTRSLSANGQMHEGITSTYLGMKGIPSLSESMGIQRDIELCRYTEGRMHFSCISTREGVELIRKAKAEGLSITADVSAAHLFFTDEALSAFNTNLKVFPPFRSETDREALWQGVFDGTLDAIVSNHIPHDIESKKLEFDLADFGMLGLETAFSAALSKIPTDKLEGLIDVLANGARKVLQMPVQKIEKGNSLSLTIFDQHPEALFEKEKIKSLSKNSGFIGLSLKGNIKAIFNQILTYSNK